MIWYEEEVVRVEKEFSALTYEPETVFYGSSSFTLWTTLCKDFADLKPVNLGFGGSTLAACSWFFDRLLAPVKSAKTIVIYAGDNDLGDGRNANEVCLFYRQLIGQIRETFGNVPVFFISVKPSLKRWEIIDQIKLTNSLIQEEISKDPFQHYIDIFSSMVNYQGYPKKSLFEADGLHLSADGYALWKKIIVENLNASINSEELLKAP
jgi:lysophospholipase L1-like esterase